MSVVKVERHGALWPHLGFEMVWDGLRWFEALEQATPQFFLLIQFPNPLAQVFMGIALELMTRYCDSAETVDRIWNCGKIRKHLSVSVSFGFKRFSPFDLSVVLSCLVVSGGLRNHCHATVISLWCAICGVQWHPHPQLRCGTLAPLCSCAKLKSKQVTAASRTGQLNKAIDSWMQWIDSHICLQARCIKMFCQCLADWWSGPGRCCSCSFGASSFPSRFWQSEYNKPTTHSPLWWRFWHVLAESESLIYTILINIQHVYDVWKSCPWTSCMRHLFV